MQRFMAAAAARASDLSPAAAAELAWAVARCDRSLSRAHGRAFAARLAAVGLHGAAAIAATAPTAAATAGGGGGVGGTFAALGGVPGTLPGSPLGRSQRDGVVGTGGGGDHVGNGKSNSAKTPPAPTHSPSPSPSQRVGLQQVSAAQSPGPFPLRLHHSHRRQHPQKQPQGSPPHSSNDDSSITPCPPSSSAPTALLPCVATSPSRSSQAAHSLLSARAVRISVDRVPVHALHGKRVLRTSSKVGRQALLQACNSRRHTSSSSSSRSSRASGGAAAGDSSSSGALSALTPSNRSSSSSNAGEAAGLCTTGGEGSENQVWHPQAQTGEDPTVLPFSEGVQVPPQGALKPVASSTSSCLEEGAAVHSAFRTRAQMASLQDECHQEEASSTSDASSAFRTQPHGTGPSSASKTRRTQAGKRTSFRAAAAAAATQRK
eukprot:1138442-Pelagomonas_calceolata.AAC.4